jgi:hypothetical protein
MDDDARISHYLEMWKQTIAVQQHFNDIEWRIRGLALTALTFALGAAAVAARERTTIPVFRLDVQLSTTVLALGLMLWFAFYFVDKHWYHRLLVGAVVHGAALEEALRGQLPLAGLTRDIGAHSPSDFRVGWGRIRVTLARDVHSTAKLGIFYAIGAVAMLLPAVAFQIVG